MSRPEPEDDLQRRILDCLADRSRQSPRGPHRHAYSEEQLDRKIRDEASLPLDEAVPAVTPILADRLLRDQTFDLLRSLGLTDRQVALCRLKLEGGSNAEIAESLGIGVRRVSALLQDLRAILRIRLGDAAEPGDLHEVDDRRDCHQSPYYGWQEVFLDSQRRR